MFAANVSQTQEYGSGGQRSAGTGPDFLTQAPFGEYPDATVWPAPRPSDFTYQQKSHYSQIQQQPVYAEDQPQYEYGQYGSTHQSNSTQPPPGQQDYSQYTDGLGQHQQQGGSPPSQADGQRGYRHNCAEPYGYH